MHTTMGLVIAFMFGGCVGILVMALMTISSDNEEFDAQQLQRMTERDEG